MKYLLDTHALIWWLASSRNLTSRAYSAIEDEANEIFVSAASAWEITTKHRLGKLSEADRIAGDVLGIVVREEFTPLPISMAHAELAGRLEGRQRDPFDRMLIGQALIEGLVLISNETAFDRFGVARLW